MRRYAHRSLLTAMAVFLSAAILGDFCWAIGHYFVEDPNNPGQHDPNFFNDRYYQQNLDDPLAAGDVPPADLVAPRGAIMVGGTGIGGSGSLIAPAWMLTAGHVTPPSSRVPVEIPNSILPLGVAGPVPGYTTVYYPILQFKVRDDTGAGDIAIYELDGVSPQDVNGQPIFRDGGGNPLFDLEAINQNYLRIAADPVPGSAITHGGFGKTFEGAGTAGLVSVDRLLWGRNVLNSVGTYAKDTPFDQAHIRYESHGTSGDSGSAWLYRDGWEWHVTHVHRASDPEVARSAGLRSEIGGVTNRQWIIDEVLAMGGPNLANEPAALPKPSPTTAWTGGGDGVSWGDVNNWDNGLPQFNATTADVVSFETPGGNSPVIDSAAEAQDVFVGLAGSSKTLHVNTGGSLRAEALFAAADTNETGFIVQSGGTIDVNTEYIGFRGSFALYQHSGGTNKAAIVHVGEETSGTGGVYLMQAALSSGDAPKLEAGTISIGTKSGANGQFEIDSTSGSFAEIEGGQIFVGANGTGTFDQETGTIDVEQVEIGRNSGSTGTYNLKGGSLTATTSTSVGIDGTGSFLQTGGSHTTPFLNIGSAGNYEIQDGTLTAGEIKGSVKIDGLDAKVVGADLSGVVDFTSASFQLLSAANGQVEVGPQQLVLLDSTPTPGLWTVPTGNISPHVIGNPVDVTNGTIRVSGVLNDPVNVGTGGVLIGHQGSGRTDLDLQGQLSLSGDASVNMESGSDLRARQGISVSSGTPMVRAKDISGTGRVALGGNLTVQSGATLDISGGVLQEDGVNVTVNGAISIHENQIDSIEFVSLGSSGTTVTLDNSAEDTVLFAELGAAGSDLLEQQKVGAGPVTVDIVSGNLEFDILDSFVPNQQDVFNLIDVTDNPLLSTDGVQGIFDKVELAGEPQPNLILDDGNANLADDVALAVLYPGDIYTKDGNVITVGDGEVVTLAALPGDLNGDNRVNAFDQTDFLANFGMTEGMTWSDGDLNGDGAVNAFDNTVFLAYFGVDGVAGGGAGSGGGAVPEPGSLLILVTMFAATVLRREFAA